MKIQPNSKLVMIGDSVTDCNRTQPVGEGLFEALGNGYVNLVNGLLGARYPNFKIRVVNMGTSGNTVRDLKARWQTDVLDLHPDWLSVMIGINDIWRQFDTPLQSEWAVGPEEYQATLEELVAQTRPTLRGMVLMTPYYIEPNPQDAMRARMDQYGTIVKKIAHKYDALLVDTQAAFNGVLEHLYPATLAWDRVHPNTIGAMVLARAFLAAVDYEY